MVKNTTRSFNKSPRTHKPYDCTSRCRFDTPRTEIDRYSNNNDINDIILIAMKFPTGDNKKWTKKIKKIRSRIIITCHVRRQMRARMHLNCLHNAPAHDTVHGKINNYDSNNNNIWTHIFRFEIFGNFFFIRMYFIRNIYQKPDRTQKTLSSGRIFVTWVRFFLFFLFIYYFFFRLFAITHRITTPPRRKG